MGFFKPFTACSYNTKDQKKKKKDYKLLRLDCMYIYTHTLVQHCAIPLAHRHLLYTIALLSALMSCRHIGASE